MLINATLPDTIPANETIVLPISMSQPLERGSRLAAILTAFKKLGYQHHTTILVCDYLNRHNCGSEEEAILQGDTFLSEHADMLAGFKIMRWQEFLDTRNQTYFLAKHTEVKEKSVEGSAFYNKMKKTWEKCLSASQPFEASLLYQIEEYAAIVCMDEFDHLFYPKRITNGMAYLYNFIEGKKPQYHHIKVSDAKPITMKNSTNTHVHAEKKDRRHIHIAFRALLEQMDMLLASGEMAIKAKHVFAEEAENLLMSYGLLGMDKAAELSQVSPITVN